MPTDQELLEMAAHPRVFRSRLLIDCDGTPRPLAEALQDNPWQQADFEATDGGWMRAIGLHGDGKHRAWMERPRGHSKSSDAAIGIAYALFASRVKQTGILASGDEDQAGLVKDALAVLTRLNPWLAEFLRIERTRIVNPHTGSEARVITSDAPSSYGLLPSFIVADEVSHWTKPDLWWSLISAADKRVSCYLLAILNAGWSESWQYEFRQKIWNDPDWYCSALPGPVASWIPQATYSRQRRLLPVLEFNRQWGNQWGVGTGLALEQHVIDAAFANGVPMMTGAQSGWNFCGGLDLSSTRDFSAFAIVGKGEGRHRLAAWWQWVPTPGCKVNQQLVKETILAAHKAFHLKHIIADAWQAEGLCQQLQQAGISIDSQQQSGQRLVEQALHMCSLFNSFAIDLPADDQLERQLNRLRLEKKAYGVRLVTDRTAADGHCDLLSAATLAAMATKRLPEEVLTWGGIPPTSQFSPRTNWTYGVRPAGGYRPGIHWDRAT